MGTDFLLTFLAIAQLPSSVRRTQALKALYPERRVLLPAGNVKCSSWQPPRRTGKGLQWFRELLIYIEQSPLPIPRPHEIGNSFAIGWMAGEACRAIENLAEDAVTTRFSHCLQCAVQDKLTDVEY